MSGSSVLIGVILLVGGLVLALVRSLVVDEAKGWSQDLCRRLVERAAECQPLRCRENKLREWNAELFELSGKPISSLIWSMRLFRLRRATAHELRDNRHPLGAFGVEQAVSEPEAQVEMPQYLKSLVDGSRGRGWDDILAAMRGESLSEIDQEINAATEKFLDVVWNPHRSSLTYSSVSWSQPVYSPRRVGDGSLTPGRMLHRTLGSAVSDSSPNFRAMSAVRRAPKGLLSRVVVLFVGMLAGAVGLSQIGCEVLLPLITGLGLRCTQIPRAWSALVAVLALATIFALYVFRQSVEQGRLAEDMVVPAVLASGIAASLVASVAPARTRRK